MSEITAPVTVPCVSCGCERPYWQADGSPNSRDLDVSGGSGRFVGRIRAARPVWRSEWRPGGRTWSGCCCTPPRIWRRGSAPWRVCCDNWPARSPRCRAARTLTTRPADAGTDRAAAHRSSALAVVERDLAGQGSIVSRLRPHAGARLAEYAAAAGLTGIREQIEPYRWIVGRPDDATAAALPAQAARTWSCSARTGPSCPR